MGYCFSEPNLKNWVEDLYWKQLDLNYPGMSDAMVQNGKIVVVVGSSVLRLLLLEVDFLTGSVVATACFDSPHPIERVQPIFSKLT
ncbi:hypothetical protein V2J09_014294 [Rumex salicifolius]